MIKVLFVASEAVPFVKTGGLGDVIGSLPGALRDRGVDARVILPKYSFIPQEFKKEMAWLKTIDVPVGWRKQYCGIEMLKHDGVTFYFLDNEYYFKRPGPYGYYDDGERFAFFSRAVLEAIPYLGFRPHILHCHDWQGGAIPLLLKALFRNHPVYRRLQTVFTIHNLRYQGIFPPNIVGDLLGLGPEYLTPEGIEFFGNANFMKAGLMYSNIITTVSTTYAQEIQTPFYGEGLEGVLQKKQEQLYGVLNGIDYAVFNPRKDPHIFKGYGPEDLQGKVENKIRLQSLLNLEENPRIPLLGLVSRLVAQKGLDLLEHVLKDILAMDVQMVVLGSGEKRYEEMFRKAGNQYSKKISAHILFDNALAHKIYAASDLFLMPSLFEPCGLGQLIAMKYGTLPLVRETGGLKDTVQPYEEETGEGYGFTFTNYNAHEMLGTIQKALEIYRDQELWNKLMQRAMKLDFSWNTSAGDYISLYKGMMKTE